VGSFFDQNEILGILHGFNPWWSGKPVAVPQFHRLAFKICHKYLKDKELKRALLLSGPRRVGKTTILEQIASELIPVCSDPKSIFYVSLDHPILKLLKLPEILRIYHENVFPEGQAAFLLLDEVQYHREWDLQLKQLIDRHKEYRILATGSASVVQSQHLIDSGVGRWMRVPVPTLSFYEFLQIRGEDTSRIPDNLRPIDLFEMDQNDFAELAEKFRVLMPLFQRYLVVGGFPETARHPDTLFCQRLLREDVVERVLKRDMTALFGVRNVGDLENLFTYLCLHSGGIFAVKTCANALETNAKTVSNYLELLEQANLVYRLPPWGLGGKKILKPRDKVYLVDAALRNAVLLRGEEILQDSDEMGTIIETTILRHLYAYYYRETPEIRYWRDAATEKEVDIIIKSPAYLIPVEVKYQEKAELTKKQGLYIFCKKENPKYAYMVTRNDRDFSITQFADTETRFLNIPAHIFAYLLGQAERLLWE